ncbi:pre-mRNA-processing factor 39-like isoform X2 [Rana temporaria]|uniref:pre-mRNA-processing factor 39-like isoform X2 n=1 Tax=Rana temporaria TaxID=8407 RepID=UPI001AAC6669|nr:pre-mRNA-processing factor 39-like isoform X2 [Rana temporaria]
MQKVRKTCQHVEKLMMHSSHIFHFVTSTGRSMLTWSSIMVMKKRQKSVFREAVNASGMEFHSDVLWRMYTEFEIEQKNLKEVTVLFDRVLAIPTQLYKTHYERFRTFVFAYSPIEILKTEELDWIHSRVQIESDNDQIAAEDSDDCFESLTESDIAKFREHILQIREQLYIVNEAEVEKRWNFEERIKRLYFYAIPMNAKQLQNWRDYLEFEVSQGQHERIVLLYERCLMSCALYEDFWLSYAQYMECHSVESARSVFERACRIHLPLKYGIHLQWAAFEEKHGCLDSARAILCRFEERTPGLAIVRLRRVGLEQRNGNLQEAERLLKEAVQISAGTKLKGFYAVKLSRLILKLQRDPHKAKAVLGETIKKYPDNPHLHMCMLEIKMSTDEAEDAPLVCLEEALKCKLSDDSKKILSQKRLEFLEDFGSSPASWIDAYNEHQTYLKTKIDDGNKDIVRKDSISEDCYPPGVPPPPKSLKQEVPPEDKSTTNAPEPARSLTSNVSVPGNAATVSFFSKPNTMTATVQPYPSSNYYSPRPLFAPKRPYGPPQNAPMQPFFNQYSAPREFNHFNQGMIPPPPPGPYSGPPAPLMDNYRMRFNMPPMFGYGPWFQNFGAQGWNRFFPPQ